MFRRKIELYNDLVAILKQEKQSLSDSDVDALWCYAEKKQIIAGEIEEARQRILEVLTAMEIEHGLDQGAFSAERVVVCFPAEERGDLKTLQLRLDAVKREVHRHSKANKDFVEEYLKVLDDMISVITGAANPQSSYDRKKNPDRRGRANMLLHREV